MRLSSLLILAVIGVAALVGGCKKGCGAGSSTSQSADPIITKPYDELTEGDVRAALLALGWTPGHAIGGSSAGVSSTSVTARKDASTPTPQLTVAVFHVPADSVDREQRALASEYVVDVQGMAILAVKYYPPDQAAAATTLARLLGR